jgi:hypothetical protein
MFDVLVLVGVMDEGSWNYIVGKQRQSLDMWTYSIGSCKKCNSKFRMAFLCNWAVNFRRRSANLVSYKSYKHV